MVLCRTFQGSLMMIWVFYHRAPLLPAQVAGVLMDAGKALNMTDDLTWEMLSQVWLLRQSVVGHLFHNRGLLLAVALGSHQRVEDRLLLFQVYHMFHSHPFVPLKTPRKKKSEKMQSMLCLYLWQNSAALRPNLCKVCLWPISLICFCWRTIIIILSWCFFDLLLDALPIRIIKCINVH